MTTTSKSSQPFQFKQFSIKQDQCTMKIGTDGVLLGAWADVDGAARILDIGTGTGVIAIMAAQRNPKALITAVEIEAASYEEAKENIAACPWSERMQIENAAIQDFAKACFDEYDLIVCNPPFFTGGTLSENNDRAAVRHTIKLPTGDLLSSTRKLLSRKGRLAVILPYLEGLRFKEQAEQYGFHCTRLTEVKPKVAKPVERLLMQFETSAKECLKGSLVIQHDKRNDYTKDYIALTKAFYLKM